MITTKKTTLSLFKKTEKYTPMDLLQKMFELLRTNSNYITSYATDFIVHDVETLKSSEQDDVYAWGLRLNGTHLYKLTNNTEETSKELGDHLKNFTHDLHKSIRWYLVKVTKSGESKTIFNPPQGTLEESDIDSIIDLYNQTANKPIIPVAYYA